MGSCVSHRFLLLSQRPLSKKELAETPGSIIEVHPQLAGMPASLTVYEPKLKVDMTAYTEQHKFLYDSLFDEDVGNLEVYRSTAAPLINRVFEHGQSSTCFAYGATGAGKVRRALRSRGAWHSLWQSEHAVLPRACFVDAHDDGD